MTEKVGIKAILDDHDFQRGLQSYLRGLSRAQGETQQASSSVGRAWGGLGRSMEVALGFIIHDVIVEGFRRISGAAIDAATQSFEAVASYERLGLALTTLVARELKQGEERTVMTQQRISLTEKEQKKLEDLRDTQESLAADIPAAQARLEKLMAGKWVGPKKEKRLEFEDPRIVNERQQALDAMREKLGEVTAAIAALEAKESGYAAVQMKVWVNQMAMNEAMGEAGPRAKELIDWIEMLAIKSPFGMEAVAQTFRMAMVYQFTTKEAQRLTQATLDFAAGSGLTGDAMERIGYALGQMHLEGKATGYVLRHLALAGLPVRTILAEAFKVSTERMQEMIEDGLVPGDKAIQAIVKSMEEDFGGAAARQAESLAGLKESLIDLKGISLRELFGGTWRAVQPFLAGLVHTLASPEFRERLRGVGNRIGDILTAVIGLARGTKTLPNLLQKLGMTPEQQMHVMGIVQTLGTLWGSFKESWLQPALDAAGRALGTLWATFKESWLQPALDAASKALQTIWDAVKELATGDFKGALKELGFDEAAVKRIERAAGAFGILWGAINDLAGRDFRGALKKLGFDEATIKGIEQMAGGFGTVGQTLAKVLTGRTGRPPTPEEIQRRRYGVPEEERWLGAGMEIATQLVAGIVRGLGEAMAGLGTLAEQFKAWAQSPEMAAKLAEVGEIIGTTIRTAIETLFKSDETGKKVGESIIVGLWKGIWNIREGIFSAGLDIAKGLVDGLVGNVDTDANRKALSDEIFSIINAVAHAINWPQTLWEVLTGRQGAATAEQEDLHERILEHLRTTGRQDPGERPYAAGGDFIARRMQVIRVGEAGPERVTITPLTQAGQGWLGPLIGSMTIHAPGGPAQVRQAAYLGVLDGVRAVGLK